MGATLAKVAYSPVIREGLDFAGALFDRNGKLVACGDQDLTGLLGTLEPVIELLFSRFDRAELRDGDIFASNSPHESGSHLNDIAMVKPLFAEEEIIAFVANIGHWTDIGGATPGSINPMARDAYAEGIRIRPIRLVERGELRRDIVDLILDNVRLPYEANGDIWAQMRSLDAGASRVAAIVERHGVETVASVFDAMHAHGTAMFESEFAKVRNAVVEFEDFIDADPLDPSGRPVRVHLKVAKSDRGLVFDFSGSDPQPRAGIGCSRALTQSGVYVATLNLFHDIPFNHGFTRNVEIITTERSCVHVAFPSPISGCAAGAFEKVIACVLGCLGQLAPEKQVGSTYNLINVTSGGEDTRHKRPFVMYMWNEGGFGGGPDRDGGDAPTMAMYATGSRNQPTEILERFFPVLFTRLEIAQDSAGPGFWRGCPGIRHAYRLTDGEASAGVFGDRRKHKPWGVQGGLAGGGQNVFINSGEVDEREVGVFAVDVPLKAGEILEVLSSGGGGYGDPFLRDPERVLRDVELGFVSSAAAAKDYGVAVECLDELTGRWEVDRSQTAQMRRKRP